MGVLSTRIWAREMSEGNNNHQAVSMAGNATPMMSRMKKIADISAIGMSFRFVGYKRYRDGRGKVAG
jgi:hypothetical protein